MNLQVVTPALLPPSADTLSKIAIVHEALLKCGDAPVTTEHVLHGGMYCRTIRLASGVVLVGSLIKLPTVLIVSGSMATLVGDDWIELEGYNVLPGSAGRKQLLVARSNVEMTMVFPTQAKTVEDAENEVFAEADLLMSRSDGSRDTFTITGE